MKNFIEIICGYILATTIFAMALWLCVWITFSIAFWDLSVNVEGLRFLLGAGIGLGLLIGLYRKIINHEV